MDEELSIIIIWITMAVLTIGVMQWDKKRMARKARESGQTDFTERGIRPYLFAAFMFGSFVLIFYFWASRRGGRGFLTGLGAFAGICLATGLIHAPIAYAMNAYEIAKVREACADPAQPGADEACASGASWLALKGRIGNSEESRLLKESCKAGGDMSCAKLVSFLPMPAEEVRRYLAADPNWPPVAPD